MTEQTLEDLFRQVLGRPAALTLADNSSRPRRPMPRTMRPLPERMQDQNPGVRRQAMNQFERRGALTASADRGQAYAPPRNQVLEAGRMTSEATGVAPLARVARDFNTGDPATVAIDAGMGALGVLGTATLGMGGRPAGALRPPVRTPMGRMPTPPPREIGAGGLPIAPARPFRNSLRGGSDDLASAAAMGRSAPDAGNARVADLRQRVDPFGPENTWEVPQITIDDVRAAVRSGRSEARRFDDPGGEWTRQDHINRIAELVRNPDATPIDVTSAGGVNDGLHRLAAAIVRGDETIPTRAAAAGRFGAGDQPALRTAPSVQFDGNRWEIVGPDGAVIRQLPPGYTAADARRALTETGPTPARDGNASGQEGRLPSTLTVEIKQPPGQTGTRYRLELEGQRTGFITVTDDGDVWTVNNSHLDKDLRNQGHGVRLYEDLVSRAREAGARTVRSGHSVSADAQRAYEGLQRRGYRVTRTDTPDGPTYSVSTARAGGEGAQTGSAPGPSLADLVDDGMFEPGLGGGGLILGALRKERVNLTRLEDAGVFDQPMPRRSVALGQIRRTDHTPPETQWVDHYTENAAHEPIIVRQNKRGGYDIIDGHHRLAAAQRRGAQNIEVYDASLYFERNPARTAPDGGPPRPPDLSKSRRPAKPPSGGFLLPRRTR